MVQKMQLLEEGLISKLERRREEIADRHIDSFVKKQKQEMHILKQKISTKREELLKLREVELER